MAVWILGLIIVTASSYYFACVIDVDDERSRVIAFWLIIPVNIVAFYVGHSISEFIFS